VEYDLKQDKVNNGYRIGSCCFLTDITLDTDTNIYVSVIDTSLICRISKGKVDKWLETEEVSQTNGIFYHDGKLIVIPALWNNLLIG
jgi:hypothetical protein